MKLAQGSYQEWSLAQDVAFWEGKLKSASKGSDDEQAILKKISTDKLAITRQTVAQQTALNAEAYATAEKMGSAAAQAEVSAGRQRLELGKINGAQMVEIEKNAANRIYELQVATLDARLAELKKNNAKNIGEIQRANDQLAELEQAHSGKILDIDSKAAQDAAKEQKSMADEAINTTQTLGLGDIERRKAIAEKQLADKQITNAQMIALELQLAKETLKVEQDALIAKKALLSTDPTIDIVAKKKIDDQMLVLDQKCANDSLKIQAKATDDIKNNWTQLEGSITSSMTNAMTGIVEGTSTVSNGFKSMAKSVLGSVISMFAQIAAGKIKDQALSMLGFGKDKVEAGVTADAQITSISSVATANTTAATTSAASWATSATAQITSISSIGASHVAAAQLAGQAWAGVAGAAGVASFAAAPWPVDIGAPAFGAAMYASAAGFSAEGGFDIPAGVNPVTQLHEKEMVLPAKQADAVRDMANAASGKGGAGGNVNLHVHAMDAQSVKRLFENNGTALMDVIRKQRRNFAQ